MEYEKINLAAFDVIGKEGSTKDGADFVKKLWQSASADFDKIKYLAKYNQDGTLPGMWGCMTDNSRNFLPWKNFGEGLYLAGVEAIAEAAAPEGWTIWHIPAFEYIKVPAISPDAFSDFVKYMAENKIELVGAIQDFTDVKTKINYLLFPIKKN